MNASPTSTWVLTTQPDQRLRGVCFSSVRSTVVEALAAVVTGLQLGHPTRVGIDGRSAAGKTTLANELAVTIQLRGREVLRAELDDFHRPGHKFRSMRGEWTPQSYYAESYDYAAVRQLLLEPLGPGGNRRCRTRLFDSYHDVWLPEEWHCPPANAVVLIDGGFLLRPELAALWDYSG
jgi:uridine kinase